MACAVGTFDDVTPLGRSAFRWRRSRGFICGVVGAGFLTSTWLIATFATMHSIATPYSPSDRLAEVATAPKVAPSPRHERLIHVGKADRLAAFDAKPAVPLTASLIQSHAERPPPQQRRWRLLEKQSAYHARRATGRGRDFRQRQIPQG